jgi:hypothetical protein
VERARLATWAEFLHLEAIWIVTTILLGDVVALFALHAGHSDLGADIRTLAGHRRTPYVGHRGHLREEGYLPTCPLWKLHPVLTGTSGSGGRI